MSNVRDARLQSLGGKRALGLRWRRLAGGESANAEGGANGGDEFGGVGFVYHSMEAGAARVGFQRRGSKDGVQHHGNAGKHGVNFAAGAHAVTKRHKHIVNDQIGPQLRGFFNGRFSVGGLAANFPVVAGFSKQFCDGPTQEVMVVRD